MRRFTATFDENTGHACYLYRASNGKVYRGEALCHTDDKEFMSKLTGLHIAKMRCMIEYAKDEKIRIYGKLQGIKQIYYGIIQSKNFNRHNYESKMIYKQMKLIEKEYKDICDSITELKNGLKTYLDSKAAFQKDIINKRKKNSSNN